MASVNEYLKKLLYQYDCVVVPELGAFLTHYQPASFTEASGLFLPPRKRVAFNEALRLDDGILANYIMLHEPVTREGAQRHISQFVGELRQQVETTGRFEIDGLGSFSHNDEGRLQFEPSLRHNFHGEAYGLSAISATLVNQQQEEPALQAVAVTAVGPVLVAEEETNLVPLRRSLPAWRVAAAVLLIGSLGFVSYFSVIKPGQPLQSSLDPANLLRVPAAWLSAKNTPAKVKSVPAESTPTTPVAPAPAAKPEPVAVTPTAPAAIAKPATAPVATSGLSDRATALEINKARHSGPFFTVIAGSFASKRNALRLRRQLRDAGYGDAFVIMPSAKGQLYKVAAAGSVDRSEAVANASAISELAGTTAWILKN